MAKLSSTQILAMYNATHKTKVSADASLYQLGAVLQQKQASGEFRPIAYTSCALSETEQHYAQIEMEALAVTWARERCRDYLTGMQFHIEMDHKPLVPLLTSKNRFRKISNSNSEILALSDAIYVFNVKCSREKPFHCRCTFSSTCH